MNYNFNTKDISTFMDLFHCAPQIYNGSHVKGIDLFKEGIIFVKADNTVYENVPADLALIARNLFAVSNADWNKSFHKSWGKVTNADYATFIYEQAIHYFSTYGMEALGMAACPVIPVENIIANVDAQPGFKAFTVIRVMPTKDLMQIFDDYLRATVAPHKNKVQSIIELMRFSEIAPVEIASFEIKVARYRQVNMVPSKGDEFLRYLIYCLSGGTRTLLIKDKSTINLIKRNCSSDFVVKAFANANLKFLAESFHRFKPLWLAFKENSKCAPYINKMRRLADTYHVPMSENSIQFVSKLASEGNIEKIRTIISNCSNRQLIKLGNYIFAEFNTAEDAPAIYNIRNGKAWINENRPSKNSMVITVMPLINNELNRRFKNKFNGNIFLIPSYIKYAAPISEKQFIGNIPYGTSIELNHDNRNVMAIYWEDYKGRVDLDLHLNSPTNAYGWNARYRSDDREVMYSGDLTSAADGAVEAYSFYTNTDKYVLSVNNFTAHNDVPFKFFITREDAWKPGQPGQPGRTVWNFYGRQCATVNVEDALFTPIPLKFNESNEQTIGLINEDGWFYFYGAELGDSIVPKREYYPAAIEAISTRLSTMLSLERLLKLGGAQIVDENSVIDLSEEDQVKVVDLSPAALTARSILELIDE